MPSTHTPALGVAEQLIEGKRLCQIIYRSQSGHYQAQQDQVGAMCLSYLNGLLPAGSHNDAVTLRHGNW